MWHPDSWKTRPAAQQVEYADPAALAAAVAQLRRFPPLVTSWEIERLKLLLAAAQRGETFVLQGGDCAERMVDCAPEPITGRLKILLQMSLVLFHSTRRPIVRIGRFAGQYGKPRSSLVESRPAGDGGGAADFETLPSYFGDMFNREEFTEAARRPDPQLMVEAYFHSGLTLNFIRSLVDRGFADLHHPENWDLGILRKAGLPPDLRDKYRRMCDDLLAELSRAEATGAPDTIQSRRAEFFTSHEGLNLHFESAQTRRVPRREGFYNLTAHLPWIGDRTRDLDSAHIEFFRGIQNPVGVKLSAQAAPDEVIRLAEALNPERTPGKLMLITRMGVNHIARALPPLIEALQREGWSGKRGAAGSGAAGGGGGVLWSCDPMHGNTITANGGGGGGDSSGGSGGGGSIAIPRKTRRFDDILRELETCWDIHHALGGRLGGIHIELTHDDVTECLGGGSGVTERDLARNYTTACDPRLNYDQAMELAFLLADKMK
jgi:3-deoxy-7-phosphoheptulonate synthase